MTPPEPADDAVRAELVLADESFRAAFDQAPGAIAMVAGPGEAGGRFLRVNQAFARLLGRTVEDLQLREIGDVTHPDDRDLEAAVGGDGTRALRKRYLHANGHAVEVEVRMSEVRDDTGVLSFFISHVLDVGVQAASERIRHDMVSTISHELRTPLTSVQGYLEMIAAEDFGPLSSDQKRMIDIALRNAGRLEEFVADLLMLARLDAAEFDPIRHLPLDVTTIVDAAISSVADAADAYGHDLHFVRPAATRTVSGDSAHLTRALQGLLVNAVKYTPPGGRITVTVGAADDSFADVEGVEIAVDDTGVGIDPSELALLGNRFYRGTDAHRRAVGGTGLGLAITRAIVEQHGGSLTIESTPGTGSRFAITLPGPGRTGRGAGGA